MPKKPKVQREDCAVAFIRMTPKERAVLQKAADKDNRSLSDWGKLRLLRDAANELSVQAT